MLLYHKHNKAGNKCHSRQHGHSGKPKCVNRFKSCTKLAPVDKDQYVMTLVHGQVMQSIYLVNGCLSCFTEITNYLNRFPGISRLDDINLNRVEGSRQHITSISAVALYLLRRYPLVQHGTFISGV